MARRELPSGWRWVRFGDIADSITDRVDDPSEAGVEFYVGLEHLDPRSLKIRRWGVPEDVEATKLRFQPGDIIFGRRRAYQRKLALAEFEGICSAHALVLRAREEVCLAEFLPFFMQSEIFFERALAISVGSLSPTINWKTLAQQEFALPPLEEQRRIAEVLWAAEESEQRHLDVVSSLDSLKVAVQTAVTRGDRFTRRKETPIGSLPEHWDALPLQRLVRRIQYGLSVRAETKGTYPIFRMMNIVDGRVTENDMKYVELPDQEFQTYRLERGDLLFNRTNSADLVGKVGIYELEGDHVFASYLLRISTAEDLLPAFLNAYLNSPAGQDRVRAFATHGVSQSNINASNLQTLLVPLPPLPEQREAVAKLRTLDVRLTDARGHLTTTRKMRNRILGSLVDARG